MPNVVVEEFHVTLSVRRRLTPAEGRAIRRTLDSRRFVAELAGAVREVLRRHPSLRGLRVTVSR